MVIALLRSLHSSWPVFPGLVRFVKASYRFPGEPQQERETFPAAEHFRPVQGMKSRHLEDDQSLFRSQVHRLLQDFRGGKCNRMTDPVNTAEKGNAAKLTPKALFTQRVVESKYLLHTKHFGTRPCFYNVKRVFVPKTGCHLICIQKITHCKQTLKLMLH